MAIDSSLQIVIAATASFFFVSLLFAIAVVICKATKRCRSRQPQSRTRTVPNSELSSIAIGESASFDPSLSQISMTELLHATRNFSPDLVIGDGSFGLVYKANLSSGVTVAVKKLSADAFQGFREFRAEMETLGNIKHPNIVKILGYYAMHSDRILVYEFIEKGALDNWLHDTPSPENDNADTCPSGPNWPLSWETRISIIKGVAKGLCYMHSLDTPIIHRDIKASNVLLDSNFEAHIADFGLARRIEGSNSHVSTQVAGTMGYMPPEYIQGATMATAMGDVYSFGILMLEVATSQRPNLPFLGEEGKEIRVVDWVRQMVASNRHMEMVDLNIPRNDGLKESSVMEFFRIATLCCSEVCKFRPTMKGVVELLDGIPS